MHNVCACVLEGISQASLVSCPITLYPATSEREKISFHQLNKETGNRIRYRKVDAETGDDVEQANIIKGYELAKGEYVNIAKNSRLWLLKANAPSRSSSSCRRHRSTNSIFAIRTTLPPMAKSASRPLP